MTNASQHVVQMIRRRDLESRLGLSRSTIYDKINPKSKRYDPTFPTPVRLGEGAVAWVADEVNDWLARQIKASRHTAS